jgi:precorrin-6A synthase
MKLSLFLVGIGTGNPEHLTLQAIEALNGADVLFIPRKGQEKADLAEVRRTIRARVLRSPNPRFHEFDLPKRDTTEPDYKRGVDDWHDAVARTWADAITDALPNGGTAAFLVWGDPALYDSTMRITDRLSACFANLAVTVIPGITSIQALTAGHTLPLNEIGEPFLVTTGRQLRNRGWPEGVNTVVVMLDGDCSFRHLPPDDIHIHWSAYAGMPQELRLSGPLKDVAGEIMSRRRAARERHGWIMDIYLLRKASRP